MPRAIDTKPDLTTFSAPTEQDIAVFEALPEDEKRRLIEAEIENGLSGKARKITAADIVANVATRRRHA